MICNLNEKKKGYCVWVDGDFLMSWPEEDYNDFLDGPDKGALVEDAVVFDTVDEAQSVAEKLKAQYQWNYVDELIRVIEVHLETFWVIS